MLASDIGVDGIVVDLRRGKDGFGMDLSYLQDLLDLSKQLKLTPWMVPGHPRQRSCNMSSRRLLLLPVEVIPI